MNIRDEPFNKIQSGKKTIEMRLNKENRRELKPGDIIEFKNEKSGQLLSKKIKNITYFPSFKELYEYFPKTLLGYDIGETAEYEDMQIYYDKSEIAKYGVIGIELTYPTT